MAKTSSLPITAKFGVIIAEGIAAGVITAGTSAAIKITNSKNSSNGSSGSLDNNFPAKCIEENTDLESVMTLFNSEYIYNIIIVYLVFNLLIIYNRFSH